MTEKQSTYSDTIGVKLKDLQAMRNTFDNLTAANTMPATKACIAWLDKEIAKGVPKASYANENDKPRGPLAEYDPTHPLLPQTADIVRTVKGETMGEQSDRLRNGLQQLAGAPLTLPAAEPTKLTGLKFNPVLNNLSDRKHSHYFKKCPYDAVDVYRVLSLFAVTDQALGHAIKKLLVAGGRGAGKDIGKDIQEAIDTLQRWQEMREEDVTAGLALIDLMKA